MRRPHKTSWTAMAACAVGMLAGGSAMAQKGNHWKIGKPIVTYWAGPSMTDANATQMKDGGWNLVWCNEKELDVAAKHGLRAQLMDPLISAASLDKPETKAALEALIARVRKHPALYCYFITDEPGSERFPELGRIVAFLREKDPFHLAYINLFPTYATNEQLGNKGDTVTAYKEHLAQFINTVHPAMLSWDHYQFTIKDDMPDYFLNMALIRKAAMDAKIPFLNIVQACTWDAVHMREPNENEMRYLVYTTAAYGAEGVSYYVYTPPPNHSPGIAKPDGTPTPVYDWLKRLNPEFSNIASQLQGHKSLAIFHAGMLPPGAEPLPTDCTFQFDPPIPSQEFVPRKPVKGGMLGLFGKGANATHCVVCNLDYLAEATYTVKANSNLDMFDAAIGKWQPCGSKQVTLKLPPGGGKLLRVHGSR